MPDAAFFSQNVGGRRFSAVLIGASDGTLDTGFQIACSHTSLPACTHLQGVFTLQPFIRRIIGTAM